MQGTLSILEELIRIPSYVGNGCDEVRIADAIVARLSGLPERWRVTEQAVEGNRRNVYVSNGDDPEILLTAHLDTVPPSDAWIRDPFVPTREGTRLYGLGAVDMKAGAAAILSALERNADTGKKIAALFYVGEEYDFCGMRAFAAQATIAPRLIVNPEPTDLLVYRGCRGVLEVRFSVEGRAAHAAMGRDGVNAITVTARAVEDLTRTLAALPDEGLGVSTVNLAWLRGGLPTNGEVIAAGNVVPPFAEAVVEVRVANLGANDAFVRSVLAGSIERDGARLASFATAFQVGPMIGPSAGRTSFDLFQNGDPKATGYFDTQLFVAARGGAPIVCGPGPSTVAHQADEYVELADLERLDEALGELF
ncbi:M20 family peptidase [bacterium]|nr:M20 family peptidase [bacterium]